MTTEQLEIAQKLQWQIAGFKKQIENIEALLGSEVFGLMGLQVASISRSDIQIQDTADWQISRAILEAAIAETRKHLMRTQEMLSAI